LCATNFELRFWFDSCGGYLEKLAFLPQLLTVKNRQNTGSHYRTDDIAVRLRRPIVGEDYQGGQEREDKCVREEWVVEGRSLC